MISKYLNSIIYIRLSELYLVVFYFSLRVSVRFWLDDLATPLCSFLLFRQFPSSVDDFSEFLTFYKLDPSTTRYLGRHINCRTEEETQRLSFPAAADSSTGCAGGHVFQIFSSCLTTRAEGVLRELQPQICGAKWWIRLLKLEMNNDDHFKSEFEEFDEIWTIRCHILLFVSSDQQFLRNFL